MNMYKRMTGRSTEQFKEAIDAAIIHGQTIMFATKDGNVAILDWDKFESLQLSPSETERYDENQGVIRIMYKNGKGGILHQTVFEDCERSLLEHFNAIVEAKIRGDRHFYCGRIYIDLDEVHDIHLDKNKQWTIGN